MEGVIALLMVFGCPVAIVGIVSHYRYKNRLIASGAVAPNEKLLARCEELEARLQTLETIVCEGDLEAAARMRSLAPGDAPPGKRALSPKSDTP